MSQYVLSFESTHAAMAASKTLASGGVDFMTIPVPTNISAGCGIALRFETDDPTPVLARVFGKQTHSDLASLYEKQDDGSYVDTQMI